ncbi:MBL fold metallo-hydrolase [Denitratisoma oestradiolicum]|uniref:Beta-lactamase domain protein n=1 Tax=Denitratisoma oestradiolicum TaxID=311182 RepID=A0A6S6XZ19_9PROT|nr:MBL fold metallo-hydrolase [Denitratisoma oestradiolicum]TWO79424.1 MBL fold metallo-hydrolase [Denitratisoma oestradiolicum]CAB1368132.1 Beta-lactamase domain protein [Denitratisoma oestradiolicum]
MKVRFWGVRGSIPVPGAATLRYGGNTTCIEVCSDGGELIVLDAGTGIFALAQSLLSRLPVSPHIFITHTHWDHIHGLPFFTPFFIPGNMVNIYGAFDIVSGQGIDQVMDVQMQYSYFPIREAELKASIEYHTLNIGETVEVGDARVTSILLNHPVIDFGYRIDCNGKSFFFTGDHEPWYNIYEPADEGYNEYQSMVDEKQKTMDDFIRGVDVLTVDCSYTESEYLTAKRGWGHSTFDYAIALARRAGAKRLVCTHHEPTRTDEALERVFAEALSRNPSQPGDPEIMLSREGLEIEL